MVAFFMKYFTHFLRVFIGLIFIVSGLAKLYPVEPFEYIFIELGVTNWSLIPFIARFVIAFELFIGLSIIANIWLKNKVYYLAQGSLLVFTVYLIYLFLTKGNHVDCGCFGDLIKLSPAESIIKNVVLMAVLFFIPRQQQFLFKVNTAMGFIILSSIAFPVILNPIGFHNIQGTEVNQKVNLSGLPNSYKTNQKVDFSKGKKVIAFFSYKCSHCINAARKFGLLNNEQKIGNLYFVVGSKKEKGLIKFIEQTNTSFPMIWMNDDSFFKYAGGRLPAIVYIENGVMKKNWYGDLFDVNDIRQHFTD